MEEHLISVDARNVMWEPGALRGWSSTEIHGHLVHKHGGIFEETRAGILRIEQANGPLSIAAAINSPGPIMSDVLLELVYSADLALAFPDYDLFPLLGIDGSIV